MALRRPIVYDVFKLCGMHGSGRLRQLSIAMLRSICEHFDIDVGNIKGPWKATYLSEGPNWGGGGGGFDG